MLSTYLERLLIEVSLSKPQTEELSGTATYMYVAIGRGEEGVLASKCYIARKKHSKKKYKRDGS